LEHVCQQATTIQDHEKRLRTVEIAQATSNATLENMSKDISEIKECIRDWQKREMEKTNNPQKDKLWASIVVECLKLLGLAITIIGGMVAALKLMKA
jgi:uncharacterized coiled-coil protein SlyX